MDDLIRRSDAEKVLCDACGNAACPKGLIPRCSYYEQMQAIPAVDAVEVRHEGWEDVEIVDEDIVAENHTMIASMFCPVCKRYASTVYHYGNPLDMMNYCSNCGARMDGRREDGDA